MTALQWLFFLLIVQVIHGLGTWKLYIKAGRQAWEAFIPVYNAIVLMQIINRPKWYTFLLFIPIINLIMIPVVWVETIRSFGYNTTKDTLLVLITLGFYIYYINYTQNPTYIADRSLVPTNKIADTISSILFAVVVATFVHTYFIQPFTIPTSSLEKSLLVGDFLFVSKYNYGARTPMTTVAAPMVHDTIPVLNTKSYSSWPQLPYFRLPGYEKIKNNDIVVFNWPTDTLYNMYKAADKRYDKPIDKKTNYVKRCVGIAGDSLEIRNGFVFINGKQLILPERAKPQYFHKVYSKNGVSSETMMKYNSTEFTRNYIVAFNNQNQINALRPYLRNVEQREDNSYLLTTGAGGIPVSVINSNNISIQEVNNTEKEVNLTIANAELLVKNKEVDSAIRIINYKKDIDKSIFPYNKNWTIDNFGPIYIPKKGASVELNRETLPFYKRIINEYEKNELKVNGNEIRINGQIATSYTFKQDYYWMMGDNRQNSLDARYFGFTPEDHVVGKPIFIWMSWDSNAKGIMNKIRWERLFTTVSGEGQPQSYFKYFLFLLAAYFAFDYFRSKKKNKEV
ncbi:signal peptidase I [uncultured Flavobacterium sp.]|uniref:signal peptidase I n=1 Tax=uncultured Flavobacterium sp. TaxID=165435 RepID=UPI0030C86C1A